MICIYKNNEINLDKSNAKTYCQDFLRSLRNTWHCFPRVPYGHLHFPDFLHRPPFSQGGLQIPIKKSWKAVGLYLINENLRRWQLIPSNPDWHWQVSGAIHVPPFLHPPLHFATKFQIVRNHRIILKLLFVIITFLAISSSVSRRTFTSVPKYSWTDSSV